VGLCVRQYVTRVAATNGQGGVSGGGCGWRSPEVPHPPTAEGRPHTHSARRVTRQGAPPPSSPSPSRCCWAPPAPPGQ
jgi:hypothetical protein